MKIASITILFSVVLVVVSEVQAADFTLTEDQTKNITTSYDNGWLYDNSTANILDGGSIGGQWFKAFNASTVNLSGGSVENNLETFHTSTVNIFSGNINFLQTNDASTTNIFGGSVFYFETSDVDISDGIQKGSTVSISGGTVGELNTNNTSIVGIFGGIVGILNVHGTPLYAGYNAVNISGGSVGVLAPTGYSSVNIFDGSIQSLIARSHSITTFAGKNFILGDGLSLIGNELFGTGTLSGQWLDGSLWTTEIAQNDSTATIILIPEPATLLLFGLGGVMIRKKVIGKRQK